MDTPKTSGDEIDFKELSLRIVFTIKRNFILIITFFLIGTILGFVYGMLGTKVYESKMMVTSDILTEAYCDKLGGNLNDMIKDGNVELIANKLRLTKAESESLVSIKLENVREGNIPLKENEKRWFLITAEGLNQKVFSKLERGIVDYLENNDFVKTRVEQRRSYCKQLIKKIEEEILSLESFKTKIYEGDFFENNKGNVLFDPTTVNSKIIQLNREKLDYQNTLEIANSVQMVEGFTKFIKPVRPNKAISLAAGSTLGLFFVGILIAFKSIRKIVRLAEEHQK